MTVQAKRLAVVTGASGGLGEAFARHLAADGWDLVLVARSADKLGRLAAELSGGHRVHAEVRPADLSDPAAVTALADSLFGPAARPVDLLVNNAGLGHLAPLAGQADRQVRDMVAVNIDALVRLTRAALPGMLARKAGGVLNIGSMGGFQPVPKLAVYAATKAFVLVFGEAVAYECRGTGVRVTTFCPGPTETGFQASSKAPNRMYKGAADADKVARKALRAVAAGRPLERANWTEALLSQLTRVLPRGWVVRIAAGVVRD